MVLCTRRGCGQQFDLDDNSEGKCKFHPGKPVFHEGLKGWSCCKRREADFEVFLKMEGCTIGSHSIEKEEGAQEFYKKEIKPEVNVEETAYQFEQVKEALPQVNILSKQQQLEKKLEQEKKEIEKQDDLSIEVTKDTLCKRRGCGHKFIDEATSRGSDEKSTCFFHPGAPVFHEGSKGWSCCKRKVLEFDEFLKIKGCKESKHLFNEKVNETGEVETVDITDCRFDWYQSPSQVILSIFAKKANKEESKIEFHENQLSVKIKFQGNKLYSKTFELFDNIQTDKSSFEYLFSKVEIILNKENNISWAGLEKTDEVASWTTFGSNDSPSIK